MLLHKVKIVAYQLGENINLKNFRVSYKGNIYSSTSTEIFIKNGDDSYIYIQNYGEVAFSNCDEKTINDFVDFVNSFVEIPVLSNKEYKEEFTINIDPEQQLVFDYNSIQVPEINADVIKIVLLNVSQSVVLDYFTELSKDILLETTKYTQELEWRGKLRTSKTGLMKFIGKTLNIQNRIFDNLYFHDAPDTVWDNEYLSKINEGLSKTFDLKTRFREIEYTLKIINNNVNVFTQLVQHRESYKLDMIIIFLILFEILNVLIGKFF